MIASNAARFLEIARAQRERLAKDLDVKMGAGSGDVARKDAAEIESLILACKMNPTWELKLVSDVTTQPEQQQPPAKK